MAQAAPRGDDAEPTKRVLPALGEIALVNGVISLWNRYVMRSEFARMNWSTFKTHFRERWEWDEDNLLTNQVGHPVAGWFYHAAARSNGFDFYEALFFDALGSVSWELTGEKTTPSMNDLITTTIGGAFLGEMLHRLYFETDSTVGRAILSLPDTVTDFLFHRPPRRFHHLRKVTSFVGDSYIVIGRRFTGLDRDDYCRVTLFNMGATVVYGDPFATESWRPFEQFEFSLLAGAGSGPGAPLWYDWVMASDAYLFSFSPLDTRRSAVSHGMTLDFDVFTSPRMGYGSEALDYAVKYRRLVNGLRLELKAHAGWSFLASAIYYPRVDAAMTTFSTTYSQPDFGTGGNARCSASLAGQRWNATLGVYVYGMCLIPWTHPDLTGYEVFSFTSLSFGWRFSRRVSLVVADMVSAKNAGYDRYPDVTEWTNRVTVLMVWMAFERRDA
jgi:hypothetical protein